MRWLAGGVILVLLGFAIFVAWHWIAAGRAMRRNEGLQREKGE